MSFYEVWYDRGKGRRAWCFTSDLREAINEAQESRIVAVYMGDLHTVGVDLVTEGTRTTVVTYDRKEGVSDE